MTQLYLNILYFVCNLLYGGELAMIFALHTTMTSWGDGSTFRIIGNLWVGVCVCVCVWGGGGGGGGYSPSTSGPVMQVFNYFFVISLNKPLS